MLSNSRAGPSPPPQLLRSALNSSAIPHTKMEWGHYTSGSLNAPCRHTQTCLVPPAQTRMHVSCSHAHRHCIQLRICFSEITLVCGHTHIKPDWAVATASFHGGFFFFFFAEGQSWLQITAGGRAKAGDRSHRALCLPTHTCTPTDGRGGSAAESAQPFCNTSRNFPSSLPVWGIDEVVPLSEFAVISPGS